MPPVTTLLNDATIVSSSANNNDRSLNLIGRPLHSRTALSNAISISRSSSNSVSRFLISMASRAFHSSACFLISSMVSFGASNCVSCESNSYGTVSLANCSNESPQSSLALAAEPDACTGGSQYLDLDLDLDTLEELDDEGHISSFEMSGRSMAWWRPAFTHSLTHR